MAKHIYITAILWISLLVLAAGCTKTHTATPAPDKSTSTAADKAASLASAIAAKTTYRISTFIDDDRNKTSQYTNYVFTFKKDGTITALDNNTGITLFGDYFFDDEMEEVDIDFDTETKLDELRGDWGNIILSNKTISLADGDDRLIFSKI